MSELSGRVRGVVNTPTPAGASGRWSVRAVNKYVGAGVWPALAVTNFESIATVTVGAGGAANIEFTSIPGTYQHLQVRFMIVASSTSAIAYRVQFNGDTASNYYTHRLRGNGASVSAEGAGRSDLPVGESTGSTSNARVCVLDILDYANTSKNTVIRTLYGVDNNGSGIVGIYSGLWSDTSAITSMKFTNSNASNFAEHTTAALYGIKA